jgi:hypothetical protein
MPLCLGGNDFNDFNDYNDFTLHTNHYKPLFKTIMI